MLQTINTVTFGIIAYNEQRYLPDLLDDLLKQTYDKKLIEVIFVDGESQDNTLEIMKEFQNKYSNVFMGVKLFQNTKRVQPAGWNIVIQNSAADALLRIDAHARLPENFVENSIKCLNAGEYVCGGPRENIIDENTLWKQMLLTAEQSMFGAGVASYRQGTQEKKYVKSLFHAAYREDVINKVGLFNEELIRTEDNEYHYRVYQAGYKICYDPQIHSYYQTRNSLKGMMRQKYLNGLWIGKTLFVCPRCISFFHLVPCAFVLAVLLTAIMGATGIIWPITALWIAYGTANIAMTVISADWRNIYCFLLPIIFLLLHLSYGAGTIEGVSSMIIKKMNNSREGNSLPSIYGLRPLPVLRNEWTQYNHSICVAA